MNTPEDTTPVIHPALAPALARQGYETLTPVQSAVLAEGAGGRDLLVSAQTGSGKTVAFGLAIAPTLMGPDLILMPTERPLALIIAPTRELALQVERELAWLYADAGAVLASCVGGMDMRKEQRRLERGAHIVVGTPGRLRDHITRGSLDLSGLRAVVLDEADEMLDLGFREDLEFILAAAPEERRTLMFSATVPKPIAELARTYQRDALRIRATAARERHADIDYQMVLTEPQERENAIINTLLYFDTGSAIVFCHTREAVKHLTARLANRGFTVVTLSGELSQAERTHALQAMRDGRARVCVATDVAARGLDLPNLDLVIHADLPSNPDTLLHRSGRTGRAGRKGTSVLIVPLRRRAAAARVLERANAVATARRAPGAEEIERRTRAQILAEAQAASPPEEGEAGFVAELLAQVPPERLAAAYLRQQLAMRPAPEDVSGTALPEATAAPKPRTERPDMTGSQWFSLPLGRRQRAEPRWILPIICKAGGITRDDVGQIRIMEEETRFEISAAKSALYAEAVAGTRHGEAGVEISPSGPPSSQDRAEGAAPFKKKPFRHKGKAKPFAPFKPGGRPGGKGFKSRKGAAKGK